MYKRQQKRSYHTIIPGFITRNGKALGPFGVMGGYMQPQGHVQVAMNLIDFHLNPQMALDAPRWQWIKDKTFRVEKSFDATIIDALRKRGHQICVEEEVSSFGRGQMIMRMENGVYLSLIHILKLIHCMKTHDLMLLYGTFTLSLIHI